MTWRVTYEHIEFKEGNRGGSETKEVVTLETERTAIIYIYIYIYMSLLNNRHDRDKNALALRNKFDALEGKSETHTPNDEHENFVSAHLEAVAECMPTKQRTKPTVPWETLAVRGKRADVKTASKCDRKNPTYTNALKLK